MEGGKKKKEMGWGEVFGIFTTLVHFRSSHNFFVCVRICKKETPFFFPVLPTPSCTWVFSPLSPPNFAPSSKGRNEGLDDKSIFLNKEKLGTQQ